MTPEPPPPKHADVYAQGVRHGYSSAKDKVLSFLQEELLAAIGAEYRTSFLPHLIRQIEVRLDREAPKP